MKRLWSYMKHYKKESILGPLFKLLEASFELLVPLVVANIIDTGIASRDGSYVLKNGRCPDSAGLRGTGQFYYGPVFRGEGGGGNQHGHAEGFI